MTPLRGVLVGIAALSAVLAAFLVVGPPTTGAGSARDRLADGTEGPPGPTSNAPGDAPRAAALAAWVGPEDEDALRVAPAARPPAPEGVTRSFDPPSATVEVDGGVHRVELREGGHVVWIAPGGDTRELAWADDVARVAIGGADPGRVYVAWAAEGRVVVQSLQSDGAAFAPLHRLESTAGDPIERLEVVGRGDEVEVRWGSETHGRFVRYDPSRPDARVEGPLATWSADAEERR